MTERQEQMIYQEGYRKGYEKGKADRPRGEWIHLWDAPDGTYKGRCDKCGFVRFFIEGHDAQYKFCPQCGADMRGEDNE